MRAVAMVAVFLVASVQAGTMDDPEILDAAGDGGITMTAGDGDLLAMWIDDVVVVNVEGDPAIRFNVVLASDYDHSTAFFAIHERMRVSFIPTSGVPAGTDEYYLNIMPSTGTTGGDPSETNSGRFGAALAGGSQSLGEEVALAENCAFDGSTHFWCDVALSLIEGFDPASGMLTSISVAFQQVQRGPTNSGDDAGVTILDTYDVAPDEGFGRDWPAPAGPDSDGDGLMDAWEQQYFGGLNEGPDGDPDGDGLSNAEEEAEGTDPTVRDSDGDGHEDGAEVAAGTSPTDTDDFPAPEPDGGTTTTTGTSTEPTTGTATSTTTTSGTSSTSTTVPPKDTAAPNSFGDHISSNKEYAGLATVLGIVLLLLCIFGLRRWSL